MSAADPFAGVDPHALRRCFEASGNAIAQAIALSTVALARDDTIPPEAFAAGLVKAHLTGLAGAVLAAGRVGQDAAALAEAVAASLLEQVAIGAKATL